METRYVAHIGLMRPDRPPFDYHWKSVPISIPYFNYSKVRVILDDYIPGQDEAFTQQVSKAMQRFLAKNNTAWQKHTDQIMDFYKQCMTHQQQEKQGISSGSMHANSKPRDIWQSVYPRSIRFWLPREDQETIYLLAYTDVSWNPATGLVFTFKNGHSLVRVGGWDTCLPD